jgi:hypothetical protein
VAAREYRKTFALVSSRNPAPKPPSRTTRLSIPVAMQTAEPFRGLHEIQLWFTWAPVPFDNTGTGAA